MYSLNITEAQQHVLLVAVMLSGMPFLLSTLLLGAIFFLITFHHLLEILLSLLLCQDPIVHLG